MTRLLIHALAIGMLLVASHTDICVAQPVVLESAEMGTPGRIGGTAITTAQWVAWRFSIDSPLAVHHIGGHLLAIPDQPGDIFAAFVRLSAVDSLPIGAPFNDDEVVATTTFRPNFPSDEYIAPIETTLVPGSYALVFGTGLYGATGFASLHNGPDQPDIPPTNLSSFIFWSIPSPGAPNEWRQNLASNMRFIVQADVIQIPGDYNLDGTVGPDDYDLWKADYGETGDQNADGNNDLIVNAADYTVWRDNLGDTLLGGAGSVAAVPEPTALTIILVGLAAIALGNSHCYTRHAFCTFREHDLGRRLPSTTTQPRVAGPLRGIVPGLRSLQERYANCLWSWPAFRKADARRRNAWR
jgi:hypothetical protein